MEDFASKVNSQCVFFSQNFPFAAFLYREELYAFPFLARKAKGEQKKVCEKRMKKQSNVFASRRKKSMYK